MKNLTKLTLAAAALATTLAHADGFDRGGGPGCKVQVQIVTAAAANSKRVGPRGYLPQPQVPSPIRSKA